MVGEARGEHPFVHTLLLGQFFALLHGNGDAHLRFDKQIVLGKKACEQHAVPVLKRALMH